MCLTLSQNLVNPDGDEMITAPCQDCEEVKRVHADTGLCDDCEEDYVYCSVCGEHHQEDQNCRHLFWDRRAGGWAGPGAEEYGQIEKYQDAILFVLQRHDAALVGALAYALRAGRWQDYLSRTVSFALRSCQIACELNSEEVLASDVGRDWLQALGEDTPREKALILQWIEERNVTHDNHRTQ